MVPPTFEELTGFVRQRRQAGDPATSGGSADSSAPAGQPANEDGGSSATSANQDSAQASQPTAIGK